MFSPASWKPKIKEKYIYAFILFGFAFAFKLHAAFALPIYLFVYFYKKNFSILHFLFISLTMLVSAIPAALFGRNIFEVFSIYFEQVGQYKLMSLNYPNIWYILDPSGTNSYESLKSASIYLTIAIILVIFIYLIKNKINLTLDKIVYILFISSYTCVLFLPEIHEKYGYLTEVFSILSAVLNKKMILPAILINSVGFAAYGKYLYGSDIDITILSLLNVFAYIYALKILIPKIILKKEEK